MIAKIKIYMLKAVHKGEYFAHMTYYGLVGVEAHGHYKYAAVILFVITVVHLVKGVIDE